VLLIWCAQQHSTVTLCPPSKQIKSQIGFGQRSMQVCFIT
jgi:hypothetical protein